MSPANGIGTSAQGQSAVFVDAATNCLYTLNPATGQAAWIVDYETGQPMVSRQMFVEPSSGNLCTTSLSGTGYIWVVSPITGQPIPQAAPQAAPQSQNPAQEQTAYQAQAAQQAQAYGQAQTQAQDIAQAQTWAQAAAQDPAYAQAQALGQAQAAQQAAAYGQTQAYEQSEAQAFGQAQVAQAQAYGQPPAQAFGQAQAQQSAAYGQAQAQAFGQAQQQTAQAYGQPQAQAFGQAQAQQAAAYGQAQAAQQTAYDQAQTAQQAGYGQPEAQAFDQVQAQQTQALHQIQVGNAAQALSQDHPHEETHPQKQLQSPADAALAAIEDEIEKPRKTSGLAILAAVLGLVAIGVYFIPPIEIGSFFIAALGVIVSIAGIVSAARGKKGLIIALAGAAFSIAAIVLVIMTQSAFSSLLGQATDIIQSQTTPAASAGSASAGSAEAVGSVGADAAASQEIDRSSLAIGQIFTTDGKLTVSVIKVKTGLKGKDGTVTGVTVKYLNRGDAAVAIDTANWKAQGADNSTEGTTTSKDKSANKEALKAGNLEPGKSAIGTIFFKDGIQKVLFYENASQADPSAGWIL